MMRWGGDTSQVSMVHLVSSSKYMVLYPKEPHQQFYILLFGMYDVI